MNYRTLGNSGLIVSSLCLGSMQFGDKMNLGNLEQKAWRTMVNHAIESIDLDLKDRELAELDAVSATSIPYPTWMHYQHNFAEDSRTKSLFPELYLMGKSWNDLRDTQWIQGK